jgi:hypothetical protein
MSEKLELQTNQKSIITVEVEESPLTGVVIINVDDIEILVVATPIYPNEGPEIDIKVTVTEQKKTILRN